MILITLDTALLQLLASVIVAVYAPIVVAV